jgi:hypothetical protein
MNEIVTICVRPLVRLALLTLMLSWGCCADSVYAESQEKFVSLVLERVSITNDIENHVTMVRCIFNVHNETGEVLSVKTFFQSPFDDIELIVLDGEGKTIAQQKFSHHQTPTTFDGRELPVQKGENTAILGFPLIGHEELFAKNDKIKLRLVGKLTGSKYTRLLASNTIDAPTARRIYAPKLSDPTSAIPWRVKTIPALRLPEDMRQQ